MTGGVGRVGARSDLRAAGSPDYIRAAMPAICLLGPQRLRPTVSTAMDRAGVEGPVAVVTAGWQEREEEVEELTAHLELPVVDLELYRRAEEVFFADGELFAAYRRRQERLRELQGLYRLRLRHFLAAARSLLSRKGDPSLIEPEQESALAAVRSLDAHHLARVREIHRRFEARWQPLEHPAVDAHRAELRAILRSSGALAVAGGHVAVLLNRLRLFGVGRLLVELEEEGGLPVFAWSAGAMAVGETVVLFHDDPPQGPGDAEVLESGLDLYGGVLVFPHAERRLRLDDPSRVALLARRFDTLRCLAFDEGSKVILREEGVVRVERARHLLVDGSVEEVSA